MATIDQIQIPSGTYDIMTKSFYGTCSTAAATAAKVVTLSNAVGWNLVPGVIVGVKFSNTNTATSVTLNVNGSGAKSIYFGNAVYTGTACEITGWANYITYYMYDGTNWVFLNNSYNYRDTNTNCYVTQTATTTSANYEVLFSVTADNTTRTEGARKNSNLLFNPSTGNLQATQLNGVTIGSSPKFTDTTYSSQAAASGGTAVSLVTTGEKYTWNNKSNLTIGTTATTAAAGNHTHATSLAADSGTSNISLAANTKYKLTAGGTSVIFTTPSDNDSTFVFTLSNVPAESLSTAGTDITQYSSATLAEIKAAADAGKFIVCEVIRANSPGRYRLSLDRREVFSTFIDYMTLEMIEPDTLKKNGIKVDFVDNKIKSRWWLKSCSISIATSTGTNQLTLAASTKYDLTIGGSSYIFTTPPNTTYSSKTAASGGTDVSLVTTGEKYTWNKKLGSSNIFTNVSSASNMPVHSYYYKTSTGILTIKLDPNDLGDASRLWITMYTEDDSAVSFETSVSLIDQDTSGGLYPTSSSEWVTPWDCICKSGSDNTVTVDFNSIYTLYSYIKHAISSSNPLSTLKKYYDDMGGFFYIYVTK